MELPQYHVPSAKTVLMHVWERLKGFIIKAGTILFVACVVMWFLGGFGFTESGFGMVEDSSASLLAKSAEHRAALHPARLRQLAVRRGLALRLHR